MTSDERAFLKAICDQPADDTVRLVFADWLEEHGQAARELHPHPDRTGSHAAGHRRGRTPARGTVHPARRGPESTRGRVAPPVPPVCARGLVRARVRAEDRRAREHVPPARGAVVRVYAPHAGEIHHLPHLGPDVWDICVVDRATVRVPVPLAPGKH
ncbi:TIGR02996 domain-containing protein [Gemmata sp. SH-PL17]|uniref:TIGR02996 domain-containing protein n=1 Tax=Gemmata sp. SH-PL17 TaxID=1630693 RepID=UPI0009EEEECE